MRFEYLPRAFAYRDLDHQPTTDYALRKDGRAQRIVTGAYRGGSELRSIPTWADQHWIDIHTTIAGVQALRSDAVGSHWSAAVLQGLPVPLEVKQFFHVTTPLSHSPVRIADIAGHRSRRLAAVDLLGVRVTPLPLTLMHVASELDHESAVITLEAIMGSWRDGPHAEQAQLTEFLNQNRHFTGRPTLVSALVDSRPNVGSPKETELRRALVRAGLPEPAVQPAIILPHLSYKAHPDMAYLEERITVEYEGDHHRTDSRQWEADIRRYAAFANAGWKVIRVTRHTPLQSVIRELRLALGIA